MCGSMCKSGFLLQQQAGKILCDGHMDKKKKKTVFIFSKVIHCSLCEELRAKPGVMLMRVR